jgi:hypothetical protein
MALSTIITGECGVSFTGQHDRRDHHHLDPGHGQRQQECPQRLAQLDRNAFRVPHHREGGEEDHGEEPG